MNETSTAHLIKVLSRAVGPTPWYWQTFPTLSPPSGQRFMWTYHGDQGPLAYLVSLGLEQEPEQLRLALNTYCRPFELSPSHLGIWCPEGRSLRLVCFELDNLKSFDPMEVAGWFKQSSERIYAKTAPVTEFEITSGLPVGTHKIDVPELFRSLDELIMPISYPTKTADDPAFAFYVVYLQAGLVEVLPQDWFTRKEFDVGRQWITRAIRDPESQRIVGDGTRIDPFLLEEDGRRLARWLRE